MKALLVAFVALAAACAVAACYSPSAPAVSVAEAYSASRMACEAYRTLPPDQRTEDADKACADIMAVCVDVRRSPVEAYAPADAGAASADGGT